MEMMHRRIFKIVLLGDEGVGKATFRMKFLGEGFGKSYERIIGANFAIKKIDNYLEEIIIAQIWEITPQHRFRHIREEYYKGSTGSILVFDISRRETMENLNVWLQEFNKYNSERLVPLLIVGCKADLREKSEDAVTRDEAEKFVRLMSKEIGQKIEYVESSILFTNEIEQGFKVFIDNITDYLLQPYQVVNEEIVINFAK